jgi:MFS family permease
VRILRVLTRNAPFRNLWAGQSISLLGTGVTELAMPLTAAVLLRASTFQMGLLGASLFLPWLLVGLPAGAWVDRRSPRRILVTADLARCVLLAAVPTAAWLGVLGYELLLGIVFLTGLCTVFAESAAAAVLPRLLDEDLLVEGNSLMRLSHSVSFVAGPGLAGWLIGVLTAPIALVVDAASYLASALFVRRLPDFDRKSASARSRLTEELLDGLKLLWRSRYLRPAVTATTVLALANGLFAPVYILFLVRTLELPPALVAVPFIVFGAGAIAGSLLAGPIKRRFGFGPALIVSGVLNGLVTFGIPLAGDPPVPLVIVVAPWLVFGLISPVYGSLTQTLVQKAAPVDMLGRISSSASFLSWSCLSLAAIVGGTLGTVLGLRSTLLVSCFVYLASPLFLIFSPARSLRTTQDLSTTAEPAVDAAASRDTSQKGPHRG